MRILTVVSALCFVCLGVGADSRDYLDDLETFRQRVAPAKQRGEIERLLKKNPNSPETHVLAANWYWNDGESLAVFSKDIPAGLYRPEIPDEKRFGKVMTLGEGGVFRETFIRGEESQKRAIEILDIARSKFPNRVDIQLGYIDLVDAVGDAAREVQAIDRFVADCQKYAGDLRKDYGEKLEKEPQKFVKGHLFRIMGNKSDRATEYESEIFTAVAGIAVREFPESEVAWNFFSVACLERGDVLGRYRALKKALALAPSDPVILSNWLDMNFKLQMLPVARDTANRLLKLQIEESLSTYVQRLLKAMDEVEEGRRKGRREGE